MRGVVSLAAALSIPLMISEGQPFPYRNLILFITFIVILVTLVFQGLTLPWLIRKVKLEDKYSTIPEAKQELIIQKKIAQYSLQYLDDKYGNGLPDNERLHNLRAKLQTELDFFTREQEETNNENADSLLDYQKTHLELMEHQRALLNKMNLRSEFDEDLIRKYLTLIDMEEFKLREKGSDTMEAS